MDGDFLCFEAFLAGVLTFPSVFFLCLCCPAVAMGHNASIANSRMAQSALLDLILLMFILFDLQ